MRQIIDTYLFENDKTAYLLVADFGNFPKMETTDRFINVGLSETLLVNTAIGLALCDKRVYIYSAVNFVLYRAYEQIKLYISNNKKLNITFLNGGAGFCYAGCGLGHYLIDDITTVQQMELNCLMPYDGITTIQSLKKSKTGVNYIRLCLDNTQFKLNIKKTKYNYNIVTFGWLVEYIYNIIKNNKLHINIIPITNFKEFEFEKQYIAIYDNIYINKISNNLNCKKSLYIQNKYDCIGYTREQMLLKYNFNEKSILSFINE